MKINSFPIEGTLSRTSKAYSTSKNYNWFMLLLLVVFAAGCKKVIEDIGLSGVCPIVSSTSPTNGASGINLTTKVDATFNEAMDPTTLNVTTFSLKQGTTPIAGVITYAGNTATFSPTSNLTPNTLYTGTITTGVKDPAHNAMISDYAWSFTTGAGPDITAPTVTSTDPANAATGVELNQKVSVAFSEVMDSLSTTTSFTLANTTLGGTPVAGSVSYNGTTAVFTPSGNLSPNTTYTGTITKGAKDLAGNPFASNYLFNFTTGATADVIAPTIISTVPANGATGVAFNSKVAATFSEAIDPSSVNTTTFTLKQGTTAIPGSVTYTGVTATFAPAANLTANTTYTVTITTGVKDLAGNAMASNNVWSFTTGLGTDVTPPTVVSTVPANNATGLAFNTKVAATFSEAIDPSTITTITFTLKNGTTAIPGTVMFTGTTATFSPSANLSPNTTYTATITTGVKDLAGNPLAANYVITFTTGASADVIPPTVISTAPANGATGVAFNTQVAATFSEPIDLATINSTTFTLKQGTTVILGVATFTGVTATFAPAVVLAANTTYTATITTGVKDLAGNPFTSNYVWSFTTGAALDIIAPTVISTVPANGATCVALNSKVSISFSEAMDPATITGTTLSLKIGATVVPGIVVYSGTTATLTLSANLLPNTAYTVTITTGAKDLAGNALASNYVANFTTCAAADVIAPTVISTNPSGTACVPLLNAKVSVTFSEAMDPLTITTSTFILKLGAIQVPGTVTYSGTTATFTPSIALTANAAYTATVTTGVKDLAGNALVSNYVINFTICLTADVSLGSISIYGTFGGNAGITNQGINTVINGSIGTTGASTLITGFHDGTTGNIYTETPLNIGLVTGRIYTAPPAPGTTASLAIAVQAAADATTLYNSISPASKPGGGDPGAGELGGLTLAPGIYKSAGATFKITNGDLTLDAKGDPNAAWIFQMAAGLTVGIAGPTGARSVVLINGAQAKNVFWYVGSAAVINAAGGGTMTGTILAPAGVTFSTAGNVVQTVLNGRAISLNASVTMVNTTINVQ